MAKSELIDTEYYTLSADDILFDYQEGIVRASTNVKFISSELELKADELTVDTSTNEIKAKGDKLLLITPEREIVGNEIIYNYKKLEGVIYQAETEFEELNFQGDSVKIINDESERLVIKGASFTPCIMPEPHYHLKAEEISIIPDDRIIAHNLQFYWANIRLITFPGYVFKYKTDEMGRRILESQIPIPKIGYSTADGINLELIYPYEFGNNSSGKLLFSGSQYGDREFNLDNIYNINDEMFLKSYYNYLQEDEIEEQELSTRLYYQLNKRLSLENGILIQRSYDEILEEKEKISSALIYNWKNYYFKTILSYNFLEKLREEELNFRYRKDNFSFSIYHDYLNELLDRQNYIFTYKDNPSHLKLNYKEGYDVDYIPELELKVNKNLLLSLARIEDNDVFYSRAKMTDKFSTPIFEKGNLNYNFQGSLDYMIYTEPVRDYYAILKLGAGSKYKRAVNKKINIESNLSLDKYFSSGFAVYPEDKVDEDFIIKSKLSVEVKTPAPESAWILSTEGIYKINEKEWEELDLKIKRKYDCYSLSFGYGFEDSSLEFDIDF